MRMEEGGSFLFRFMGRTIAIARYDSFGEGL